MNEWKEDFGERGLGYCFRDNTSRQAMTVTKIFIYLLFSHHISPSYFYKQVSRPCNSFTQGKLKVGVSQ